MMANHFSHAHRPTEPQATPTRTRPLVTDLRAFVLWPTGCGLFGWLAKCSCVCVVSGLLSYDVTCKHRIAEYVVGGNFVALCT